MQPARHAGLTAGQYSISFASRNLAAVVLPTFYFGVAALDAADKDAYLAAVMPAPVPEPSTAATMALGLVGLLSAAAMSRRAQRGA